MDEKTRLWRLEKVIRDRLKTMDGTSEYVRIIDLTHVLHVQQLALPPIPRGRGVEDLYRHREDAIVRARGEEDIPRVEVEGLQVGILLFVLYKRQLP